MMVHTCNPRIWEVEAGGSGLLGLSGLHEALFSKIQKQIKNHIPSSKKSKGMQADFVIIVPHALVVMALGRCLLPCTPATTAPWETL